MFYLINAPVRAKQDTIQISAAPSGEITAENLSRMYYQSIETFYLPIKSLDPEAVLLAMKELSTKKTTLSRVT